MKFKAILFSFLLIGMISCQNSSQSDSDDVQVDHYGICKHYANQVAEIAMEELCPGTGKNPYGKVSSYEYDAYDDRYEIEVELYWTGRPWALADYRKFNIDGLLYVYHDGDYDLEISYENDAVEVTKENNVLFEWAVFTVGTMQELSD